jgi:hypothetical protein
MNFQLFACHHCQQCLDGFETDDRGKHFIIVKPWLLDKALSYQQGFVLDNVALFVTLFGKYPLVQYGDRLL